MRIVYKSENADTTDLNYLYEVCLSRFAGRAPQSKRNDNRSKIKDFQDMNGDEGIFEANFDIVTKIYREGLEDLFDVENLEKKSNDKYFYDNSKLQNMNFALENNLKVSIMVYKKLLESLLFLHSKEITFITLPLLLIKIKATEGQVTNFKFGLEKIEESMNKNFISTEDYKSLM